MMHQTVRSALRLSSPTMAARRQAPIKAVMPRRMASSSTQAAQQTVKSDAPWAIASLLVFGSLFVYVTSPPSKGSAHGGHGDSHGAHKAEASAAQDEGEDGASSASDESYEDVKKIEEKPGEGAPRGAKALGSNSMGAEEGAHLQKATKTSRDLSKPDDTTFQTGVAAAKEGHTDSEKMESNPKKVVAAAQTKRQDRDAAKESSESSDE